MHTSNIRPRRLISLGQQRNLHNWLHLRPAGAVRKILAAREGIMICKFQAEYLCFAETLVELYFPSVGIKHVISLSHQAKFGLQSVYERLHFGGLYFLGWDFHPFWPPTPTPPDPTFVTCAWMIMCTLEFGRVHRLGDYICFSNGFCRWEFAFASDALKEFAQRLSKSHLQRHKIGNCDWTRKLACRSGERFFHLGPNRQDERPAATWGLAEFYCTIEEAVAVKWLVWGKNEIR